ncbi:MAG: hypothetical protein PHI41_07280 [Erysipelotrichaceae bacterium]|nr:hypothetical protein [Erysipelotrichaceae bacterium]MDD3810450.1 hypothetical protein [Erysipelotrichaceae bacterium]
MKKSRLILSSFLALGLVACSSGDTGSDTIAGTYSYQVTGYDWGAGVNKAVLALDHKLTQIDAQDLNVVETKQVTDWSDSTFPVNVVDIDRTITDVYLCDADGNKVEGDSKYVAVEMYVSPNDGSPLLYSMATSRNTWSDPYTLAFTLSEGATVDSLGTTVTAFTVEGAATTYTTSASMFEEGSYETESGQTYGYVTYEPTEKSDTLFVWLHGGGEGAIEGSDVYIPVLANKVTALAGEEFQTAIGGAAILAPQSPTFWMDSGDGTWTGDNKTMYTESLMQLIDNYKTEYGATKVVVAGCSNGGFMTLDLMMNYPDYFTAGVPICEGKLDAAVTDEQIAALKDQAMFFIYAENDTTLDPSIYSEPTIARLKEAGATNLMVASPDTVIDTSGTYKDADGNPYSYAGHWSWIYFDNNEAFDDTTGKDSWSWIADQLNK